MNFDSQRIKKDALYKPLLRKFRSFLRKVFDGLGLSKGCHYWAPDTPNRSSVNQPLFVHERMKRQVLSFANKIHIPF
jgi:hypothetical protein